MDKHIVLLTTLVWVALPTIAQQHAHMHGHGKLLIAQEKNSWHVQFILPAEDVLGFEHAPESPKEHEIVREVAKKLSNHLAVLELDGKCELFNSNHSLAEPHVLEHPKDKVDHPAHQHGDVEVEYTFTCHSEVNKLSLRLFTWLPSLTNIEAQWILDKGQGLAVLSPATPFVAWK
jgi:hypothetical protein